MESMTLLIIGITTGFLTGFLGIGGGIIVVPALTIFLSMGIKEAIGTSTLKIFLSVFLSNVLMLYRRHLYYNFPLKRVVFIGMGSLLGSPMGATGTHLFPDSVLYIAFALLLLFFSFQLLFEGKSNPSNISGKEHERRWYAYVLLGILTGFASGLLGVGGAFIMVPLLYGVFHLSIYMSMSISFLALIFITLFSSIIHFINDYINFQAGIILTIGALPATMLGSYLRVRSPQWLLRYSFAILLAGVSFRMIWEVIQRM